MGLRPESQPEQKGEVLPVSSIHWENELQIRLPPNFAYVDENVTPSDIFKSTCITQESKSQFQHERNVVNQRGQELESFNSHLGYLCNAR